MFGRLAEQKGRSRYHNDTNHGQEKRKVVEKSARFFEKYPGEYGDHHGHAEHNHRSIGQGHEPDGVKYERDGRGAGERTEYQHESLALRERVLVFVYQYGDGRQQDAGGTYRDQLQRVDVAQPFHDQRAQGEEKRR